MMKSFERVLLGPFPQWHVGPRWTNTTSVHHLSDIQSWIAHYCLEDTAWCTTASNWRGRVRDAAQHDDAHHDCSVTSRRLQTRLSLGGREANRIPVPATKRAGESRSSLYQTGD